MKTCTKCKGEPQPLTEFTQHSRSSDGYGYHCRICRSKAAKKLYDSRRGKVEEPVKDTVDVSPWNWREYRRQINWCDNTRYVPTDAASKSYVGFSF